MLLVHAATPDDTSNVDENNEINGIVRYILDMTIKPHQNRINVIKE
jgi:hypothetical protein